MRIFTDPGRKTTSCIKYIQIAIIIVISFGVLLMFVISIASIPMEGNNNDLNSPLIDSLNVFNVEQVDLAQNVTVVDTVGIVNRSRLLTKEELIKEYFPTEDQIPNPTTIPDGYETMSACMLVMDDNHRLTEWLAYHYHVLPLRFMIVAVDPRSEVAPTHILNEWRRRGMVIIEWNDRDFWRADMQLKEIPDDAGLQTKRDRHRGRQKYFYKQCLMQLKRYNRTWVTLHDSDEFLLYNHAGGDKYEAFEKKVKGLAKNEALEESGTQQKRTKRLQSQNRLKPSKIPPPTTAEEGAMIKYIRQEQAAGVPYYQSACIGIPRLMFGADETDVVKSDTVKNVPTEFVDKVHDFDTQRFRKHAPRNDFVRNALGKVMIDVSRVDVANSPYFSSLHRPIKKICSTPWQKDADSGLRINHYLGSWESYAFRNDARRGDGRSREHWEHKSQTTGDVTDDNVRPWLDGFVKRHGKEESKEWLQRVGLPESYHNPDDEKWKLNADRLLDILGTDIDPNVTDAKKLAFEDFVRKKYASQKDELIIRAKKAIADTEPGKVAILWKKGE
jgi:hypothetical protein